MKKRVLSFAALLILAPLPAMAGFADMVANSGGGNSAGGGAYNFTSKAGNATLSPQQKAYKAYTAQQQTRKAAYAAKYKEQHAQEKQAEDQYQQQQAAAQAAAQARVAAGGYGNAQQPVPTQAFVQQQPVVKKPVVPAADGYAKPRHPGYPYTSD